MKKNLHVAQTRVSLNNLHLESYFIAADLYSSKLPAPEPRYSGECSPAEEPLLHF